MVVMIYGNINKRVKLLDEPQAVVSDDVGYQKPPKAHRFTKGQSGNPKGRPKGARNLATILDKELNAPVVIQENGRRKTITKLEATVKQLVNKAASGDQRSMQQLLGLQHLMDDAEGPSGLPTTRDTDQLLISSLMKRMQRGNSGGGHGQD